MQRISATKASNQFGELLMKSQREPVSVTKNGKAVAILMSHEDYRQLKEQALLAAIIEGEASGGERALSMDNIIKDAEKEAGLTE